MTDIDDELRQQVVSIAESIEEMDSPEEFDDPLDVKITSNLDGHVSEVTAVVATGGPHIEVDLYGGTVSGWWGSSEHTTHVGNEEMRTWVADHYVEIWECR